MGCNRNNNVGGASDNRRNGRNRRIAGISDNNRRNCNGNGNGNGNDVAGVSDNNDFRVPVRAFIDGNEFCRAVNRCIEDDVLAEAEEIRRRRRKRRRRGNMWERLGLWF
ncbi:hypothetical protein [Halobacillus sp. A5]|uniref:hypothetical protein n=1 Tax=Halobacillus sp. A5 TaxID=2880263 RepID=UPI0020A6AD6A|nr:hypothetical protein [Halobacillus sp. A5]MCP3026585.1 hypothetical protein [Halobacillus sp. A5]